MKNSNTNIFNKIGLSFFLCIFLSNFSSTIISPILLYFFPSISNTSNKVYILTGICMYVIAFPISSLYLNSIPDNIKREKRKFSSKEIITLFLITFSFMQIINIATTIILSVISLIKGSHVTNNLQNIVSNSSILSTFIFVGIIGPIAEELFFRGILINKLRDYGDTIAIITTAILFGLFHLNFNQFFYTIFLGLIFGYVTMKSGTLKYSIILHIMVNIMGSIIPLITMKYQNIHNFYIVSLFIFIILGVIFLCLKLNKIKLSKGTISIEKGHLFTTICLNLGMILSFLTCSLIMVINLL